MLNILRGDDLHGGRGDHRHDDYRHDDRRHGDQNRRGGHRHNDHYIRDLDHDVHYHGGVHCNRAAGQNEVWP